MATVVLVVGASLAWSPSAHAEGPDGSHGFGPQVLHPFAPDLNSVGLGSVGVGSVGLGLLAAPPAGSPPPSGGPGATIPVKPAPAPTPAPEDEDEDEDEDEILEQPGGSKSELEPLELEPPQLQAKRSVPPFWISRDYNTHTTSALILPPLYVHRQPKPGHPEALAHFDLSFTFAYYSKSRRRQRWINPLVLFFYGKSEHKTVWASLPLLMGYRKVGDQFNFGQFPLVWWWGNRHVKNLFVLPFHFRKKAPDQVFAVSGLLAWYGSRDLDDENVDNDRRHFVFAPVYYRFQRGLKTIDISPLYFGGKNLATGNTHRTLLPFFHWQSREFGNRKELWTLPWIRRKDTARGRDAWALPLLLTFRDRNPQRSLTSVTPLVWNHRDLIRDRSTWVVGPAGAITDPNQSISWAAPIWWRFADKRNDSSVSVIAPLALWRSSPERFAFHSLLASGWRNRDAQGNKTGGGGGSLPLLTFVGHSELRSRQFVLGGVFWRFVNEDPEGTGAAVADARRSAWGVGPLVYRSTRGTEKARFGIPPLLTFAGRDGSKSHQVVTPLFWHMRDTDPANQHDTWVLAPLYVQKRAEGFRAGLPPLFVAANDERYRYAVLPWLLFGHVEDKQEGTSRTIWPLFVHAKTPTAKVIGAGLIGWDVRREMPTAGDAVESWRDSVLFPLYYRRARGESTLHLSPLGGAYRKPGQSTWMATLAYGFDRSPTAEQFGRRGGGFLPLVHHETRRNDDGEVVGATSVLFPLYLRDRRPERDLDIWTPLVWRGRVRGDKPRNNLAIVPLYFGQRQPGGIDVDAGLLWFWSRDRVRHTHTVVAGPFYHRLTREKLITGFGPLSYWEDSPKRRLLVVPPLVVSLENKVARERTTVALPLWFDRVQAGDSRRVWMAFPFVVGVHRKHDFTKAGMAFPLFYDIHRLRKDYRFTGVVPLLFRYQKGGFRADDEENSRYTLWGSAPLFFYGRDQKRERITHSALALYWWDKSPEGWKFLTLLGGVSQKPGKSLSWYAPLVYRKVTNEQHTTFLWPLFAYHKGYRKDANGKPYKDISTTWVLPPLYVGRRDEDRRWWQSTLLVWQFRRPHKVSTAVLPPVFFLQESYKQRRLHWLLPLYVRDNNMAKGEAWTSVFPVLYVQHRNLEHNRAVQFPLVWHFDEPKRRVTIGVPLWYDVRLKERGVATQVLPLIYARRETPEKVGHMVGPGLAAWRREAEGQPPALHWRGLFWLIGGGNEDGQRYMWLFGAKIKLAPKALEPRKTRKRKRGKPADEVEAVEDEAARNEAIEASYFEL